jgi:hypothetical protein
LKKIFEASKDALSVVYVSSDRSEAQMKKSMEQSHGSWLCVPYGDIDQNANIKRHYSICAGSERAALQIPADKRTGIPALVLVDTATQEIITMMDGPDMLDKFTDTPDTFVSDISAMAK